MSLAGSSRAFANYTSVNTFIPQPVWIVLRIATLLATFALVILLIARPPTGLRLFWGLAVPALPTLFVIAPGLWRQVCPMAFVNQLPRLFDLSLARPLPERIRSFTYPIAVACFLIAVALRVPFLNGNGPWVAAGLVGVHIAALLGGLVFKGRSGWCGTFCPLGPIQRSYGQAPLVVVNNGYCRTCVGCQANCYDFNPRATVFADIFAEDPKDAGQKRFFMSMLPGLILGFFGQGVSPAYNYATYAAILLGAACASAGVYQCLVNFLGFDPYRAASVFAGAAIIMFYWFTGPTIVLTITEFLGLSVDPWIIVMSRGHGVALALGLVGQGALNERLHHRARQEQIRIEARAQRARPQGFEIVERGSSDAIQARPGQTLLDAMEGAGIKMSAGCRSGLCGADPVLIVEGADNLSPPGEEETATLKRLGLEGRARLACSCQVRGKVVFDRNVGKTAAVLPLVQPIVKLASGRKLQESRIELVTRPHRVQPQVPFVLDQAALAGLERVVIVGNGVAGTTAAEALRRVSRSLDICMVGEESHPFYNRMALGHVVAGHSNVEELYLKPDSWFAETRVRVLADSRAVSIDRLAKRLVLSTGQVLDYDRLIVATGATARLPDPGFLARTNAFVLRTAADAQSIRAYVEEGAARSAVIVGGGVLGIEIAEALHDLGVAVTILNRSARLMDRHLDPEGAQMLTRYLNKMDIAIETEAVVEGFDGDFRFDAIRLRDGRVFAADLFIACMGTQPKCDLAKACGLDVGTGIRVGPTMQTSDSSIYAIGDVAELPGAMSGLWPVATAQARTAVAAILGEPCPYQPPRVLLRLKSKGADVRSFGNINIAGDGCEVITAPPFSVAWWRVVIRDGTILGAVFVGPPGSANPIAKLLQAQAVPDPLLAEMRLGRLDLTAAARAESHLAS
jgi:nitrite reductase (NADH) large subunit